MSLASLWSTKAQKWVAGRKNLEKELLKIDFRPHKNMVWFHAASLGEFEQGRPLMELIKKRNPDFKILLSFFSPSGYEVRKNTECADWVFYLPLDHKEDSRKWVEHIHPKMVFFIKYDSWYYYLSYLKEKNIPVFLISANFREEQNFFGPFGSFLRKMLDMYTHIFVQNKNSLEVLKKYKINAGVSISGDTRFDRVLEVSRAEFQNEIIESFCKGGLTLVAGSTWLEDEQLISEALKKTSTIGLVLAPHEIDEDHLADIEKMFENTVRLSSINSAQDLDHHRVLIVDSFGMLSKLYRFGHIAYIGGGFNKSGIHNILEAAVYGVPVLWGPNYERAFEAKELIDVGGGVSIQDGNGLYKWLYKFNENESIRKKMSAICTQYVSDRLGATEKIYHQTVDTSAD